ncbi:MAG: hypothetical protein H6889_16330 [Brucellaceae bacterium]|nr:hypothetical protein [Notoacmeibacter sp.]MCC0028514.1 hypothetical protein [Brucellaceae bacterium]
MTHTRFRSPLAALCLTLALALALARTLGLGPLPALAQDLFVPIPFEPVEVPADWDSQRIEGLTLRLPPGAMTVHESRDEKLWALADMDSRTGIAFSIRYDDNPERDLRRGKIPPEDAGLVVFPDGHIFHRWRAPLPENADVPGKAEILISERPVRGKDKLVLMLMAMNTPFEAHRAKFDIFLSGISIPAPGKPMALDLLEGVLRLPFDVTWSGLRGSHPDRIHMSMKDTPGRLGITRGEYDTGPMPRATRGQAVTFMGQPAQLFAFEDGSATVKDGEGQKGQARIVLLETCLPDGRAISLQFSGMPAFFHAESLIRAFAEGALVLPEGSRPCPPETLPEGAQIVPAGQPRPAVLPPFDVPEKSAVLPRLQGTALDGLFEYDMAPGWTELPGDSADLMAFSGPEGERIVMARGEKAIAGPGGLVGTVPADTPMKPDLVLGWPVLRWIVDMGTLEARVHLYQHCFADGTPFGIGFSLPKGIWDDRAGSDLRRMIDLAMPDGVIPCPDGYLNALVEKAQGSRPAQSAPEPGPAPQEKHAAAQSQSAPPQTAPGQAAPAQSAPARTMQVQPVPRPAPLSPPAPEGTAEDPDLFLPEEGGYALYRNGRYGTHISYPATYFLPDPPPDSGDGRNFTAVDGWARFYVFAQYEAEGLSQAQRMARDIAAHGEASYRASGDGWYVISGITGGDIYYRRVEEEPDGLLHVFEISYPPARKQEFDAVVAYMAQSFGPPQRN